VQLVVETLLTTKEPLSSFEGISNQDVKELLVDNEGNLGAWLGARKAVAALGLLPEVAGVLSKSGDRSEVGDSSQSSLPTLVLRADTLAAEGRLDLLKQVCWKRVSLCQTLLSNFILCVLAGRSQGKRAARGHFAHP
jgi:hypothetical protein